MAQAHRYANLAGGRLALRLPMSPLRMQMAQQALEEWRQPENAAREKAWYRVTNQADAGPTQVNIFDEISWWGVSAEDFCAQIADIEGDLEVHLNSPGGVAFDGITIFNALRSRQGKVGVYVDGLAASAASVIAMGATPGMLTMSPGSMMMIHDASGLCMGNASDMRETAAVLDKVSDNIASVYADRTGKPAAEWRTAMVAEGWYTAQEAVDVGLADQLAQRPAAQEPSEPADPEASWSRSPIFAAWQGTPKASAGPGAEGGEESGEATGGEAAEAENSTCGTCGGTGKARDESGKFTGPCPDCGGDGGDGGAEDSTDTGLSTADAVARYRAALKGARA